MGQMGQIHWTNHWATETTVETGGRGCEWHGRCHWAAWWGQVSKRGWIWQRTEMKKENPRQRDYCKAPGNGRPWSDETAPRLLEQLRHGVHGWWGSGAPEQRFKGRGRPALGAMPILLLHVLIVQSCPTLCDPFMDSSTPGSSVHGISQARLLAWVAISFPRGSSPPRDWTWVFASEFFTAWATREAQCYSDNYG